MALFLVTSDLDKPKQNYEAIHKQLKKMGAKHVLESTWMLDTDLTAGKIRDALTDTEGLMDSNDRIVIVQVSLWASFRSMVPIREIETPQEHPVKPGNVSSSQDWSSRKKKRPWKVL